MRLLSGCWIALLKLIKATCCGRDQRAPNREADAYILRMRSLLLGAAGPHDCVMHPTSAGGNIGWEVNEYGHRFFSVKLSITAITQIVTSQWHTIGPVRVITPRFPLGMWRSLRHRLRTSLVVPFICFLYEVSVCNADTSQYGLT